jgi:2-keto-4-pentenoate hydratase/2-oxohepta-3-ene-1,7-dioic acid hydratase in catechol pathway
MTLPKTSLAVVLLSIGWNLIAAPSGHAEDAMKRFVRFEHEGEPVYGLVEGDSVTALEGDLFGQWKKTETTLPLADVEPLVPTCPSKVLAVAGNYRSHLGDKAAPEHPELFFKVPSCLIADGQSIVLPQGSQRVDYEAELVIVVGRRASNVDKAEALDYVLGITCGNDVSARDWQKNDVQWWRAKGSDTFGPCGPVIVSGIDYNDLELELRVNGQRMQHQNTGDMVHDVADVVSFASRHVTLEPGDLIYTGTPGKTSPLKPGDVVEVELEKVGLLRNSVVAGQ